MKKIFSVILIMTSMFSLASCTTKNVEYRDKLPEVVADTKISTEIDISEYPYVVEVLYPDEDSYPDTNKHYNADDHEPGYKLVKYVGEDSDVVVPAYINDVKVIQIGNSCFGQNEALTSVEIPYSVIFIDSFAFYNCINLKSVTINNGVEHIGSSAFTGCKSLESIEFPKSVTKIGNGAFSTCIKLNKIIFSGQRDLDIGLSAFNATDLKTVWLPEGTKSIETGAFMNCKNLTQVSIPSSVSSIGSKAFKDSKKVTLYVSKTSYAYKYAVKEGLKYKTS